MGIRGQLIIVPAIVAVALIFAASVAVRGDAQDEFDEFEKRNTKVLEAIAVPVSLYVKQHDSEDLIQLIAHVTEGLRNRDLLELTVFDQDRRVLAHARRDRVDAVLDDAFSRRAVADPGPTYLRTDDALLISVPANNGGRVATVSARLSLERLNAHIEQSTRRWFFGAIALFIFISIALFIGLNRLVVSPLRSLQQAVKRMGEGHLSHQAPAFRSREMNDLSQTVNRMALALQGQRDTLEQAVAERTRELQEANARLEKIAVTDGLTGLLNHRRYHEILQAELLRAERHRRPMGVLMVDVDFFKKINDSRGHPVGDEVLRRLAVVLKDALRQTDIIARYGGEEFSVILPETTKAEAVQAAERMRVGVEKALNAPEQYGQAVTVSIGVATWPDDGKTAEEVLNAADQSLYLAKRQGRNRVVGSRAA